MSYWKRVVLPNLNGCEKIQRMADLLTSQGKDRRIHDAVVADLFRGIANKAAQEAAKAAEDGEI